MEPKILLVSIREFSLIQKAYTYWGLQELRKKRATNGFGSCFLKVGKKVLIDVNEFYECIHRNNTETQEKQ